MFITVKSMITFQLPKEVNALNVFRATNNMDEWSEYLSTGGVTYTHSSLYSIDCNISEEELNGNKT